MRKILLYLFLSVVVCFTTNAQIEKGKWIGSLNLNGSRNTSKEYRQTLLTYRASTSFINTQVLINKMLRKNISLGIGLGYSSVVDKNIQPYLTQPLNNKTVTNYLGPIVQTNYYKEILKNLYLGASLKLGYQNFRSTFWQNYRSPTEIKSEQNGYKIYSDLLPIQFSYLLKKRYLFSLNLAGINYSKRRLNSPSINSDEYANYSELSYSLNPFENGFTFLYVF